MGKYHNKQSNIDVEAIDGSDADLAMAGNPDQYERVGDVPAPDLGTREHPRDHGNHAIPSLLTGPKTTAESLAAKAAQALAEDDATAGVVHEPHAGDTAGPAQPSPDHEQEGKTEEERKAPGHARGARKRP